MFEQEKENLTPQGQLALQITALPRETNGFGDIYGGWLVAQMDLAGTAAANKYADRRMARLAQHMDTIKVGFVQIFND